jgi:carboxymethylenebutenolidase
MRIVSLSKKPSGCVLVIHSWWGLTPSFDGYAKQLANEGFVVGLSDLFDGETASDIEAAKRLRRAPRRMPMYRSLFADIEELARSGPPGTESVAVAGFSMGGHWAVWLSQRPDLPIRSTVLYYAARAGSFKDSRSSFLAHYAEDDPWVSRASRRKMEGELVKAGRPYKAFDYAGSRHWFAESDRTAEYDEEAAELAFRRTVQHLRAT